VVKDAASKPELNTSTPGKLTVDPQAVQTNTANSSPKLADELSLLAAIFFYGLFQLL